MMREETLWYVKRIFADLLSTGYSVRLNMLDSRDFGLPQSRKRVIITATPKGSFLPDPPSKTVNEAISFKDLLAHVEDMALDGEIFPDHNAEGTRLGAEYDRLSQRPDGIVPTVRCGRGIKHYKFQRTLTQYELKLVQGFPSDYKFVGNNAAVRSQIGNAVPGNLGEAIARSLLTVYA